MGPQEKKEGPAETGYCLSKTYRVRITSTNFTSVVVGETTLEGSEGTRTGTATPRLGVPNRRPQPSKRSFQYRARRVPLLILDRVPSSTYEYSHRLVRGGSHKSSSLSGYRTPTRCLIRVRDMHDSIADET